MTKRHLFMVLLASLVLFALSRLDHHSLIYSLRQIPLWLIFLLLSIQVLTQLLISLQWYKIANISRVILTFRKMFYINCQGALVDAITPGVKFGGEVTRAIQLSRLTGCTTEQAAAIVAIQKFFSLSAMCLILIFSFSQFFGLLLLVVLIVLIAVGLLYWKRPSFLTLIKSNLAEIKKDKKACVFLASLSLFIWVLYPIKLILIVQLFAPFVSNFATARAAFTAYVVAMIPIFPGGLGGFEASLSALLVALGVVVYDAAVITIIFRFITFWFVVILGLFVVLFNKKLC